MKTFLPQINELERTWYVVDANDQVLGRMATRIASFLMGKEKPIYTDFLDTGDFIVVVNIDKVKLSGKKWEDKFYYSHRGYPGGLKQISAAKLMEKHPDRVIKHAVKGMLPKNKLGKQMLKRLKVYTGPEHPHSAQKPQDLTF